jgi:hypothetical protein
MPAMLFAIIKGSAAISKFDKISFGKVNIGRH